MPGRDMTSRSALGRRAALALLALMLTAQAPKPAAPGNPLLDEAKAILSLDRPGRHAELLARAQVLLVKVREKFGPSHAGVGETQWLIAIGYRGLGRIDESIAAIRETIEILERTNGAENAHTIGAIQWAGRTLLDQNRFEEADAFLARAAAATERRVGARHPELGEFLVDRARAAAGRNRSAEAEQLLLKAIALQEAGRGPDDISLAYGLTNLSMLYRSAGRYIEAEPLARRTLNIRERHLGPNHRDVASSLSVLAGLYLLAGRQTEATPLLERALTIAEATFGPEHSRTAGIVSDLAIAYKDTGQLARAEPLLRRAVAIQETARGPDHVSVAAPVNNLAVTLRLLGRLSEAEALYRRALAIRERSLPPDHPDIASSLGNLGNVLRIARNPAGAVALHERALAIRTSALGPEHPDVGFSLNAIAYDRLDLGQVPEALEASRRATRIVIERLTKTSGLAMEGEIRNGREVLEFNLRILKRAQDAKLLDGKGGEEAFEVAQWMNQTAAAGAIAGTAARFAGGNDALAGLIREQQDLLKERESLEASILAAFSKPAEQRNRAAEQAMSARSAALETRLKGIDARLTAEFPLYSSLIASKSVTRAEVAALIGANEALVAFHLGKDAAYAYVITRERSVWYRIEPGSADIEARVRGLRAGLDPGTQPADAKPFDALAAHALYRQLLGSAEPLIRGKSHLLVVASGALTSLPFHVLVTDRPEKPVTELADFRDVAWLAQRHAVTVLPTVSSLKVGRPRPSPISGSAIRPSRPPPRHLPPRPLRPGARRTGPSRPRRESISPR